MKSRKSLRCCLALLLLLCLFFASEAKRKIVEQSVLDAMPRSSSVLSGYEDFDTVASRLASQALHTVEGVWRFPSEGTLMAVELDRKSPFGEATVYRMVIIKASDMALRPGTLMGWLTPTAKRGVYDARIFSAVRPDGVTLHLPKSYTLTLDDADSRLKMAAYGTKFRFNWWRIFPYMYRNLVTRLEKSPGDIYGCVRVFPEPEIPVEPRYL